MTTPRPTSSTRPTDDPLALVVVSAGAGDPSSTRMLVDRVADRVAARTAEHGRQVTTSVIDLRELATEIAGALTAGLVGPRLREAVAALGAADGIIAGTPVYKAGASGLYTSFYQVLDDDLLIAKPVLLAATAGTARHALVVDEQLRPLFAYLRSLPVPTSLFASAEDWNDPAFGSRIDRAALELALLMDSGFARRVRQAGWRDYQHEFGSAGGTEHEVDLDSDLMKLAAGGTLPPRRPEREGDDTLGA